MPRTRKHVAAETSSNHEAAGPPLTPLVELEHLLKVVGSVAQDANKAWAEIWEELRDCTSTGGTRGSQDDSGFVPSCEWPEFLEKFWELKHYLDSIQRICAKKR